MGQERKHCLSVQTESDIVAQTISPPTNFSESSVFRMYIYVYVSGSVLSGLEVSVCSLMAPSLKLTDVNECWRYPGRLCAQTCENTPGSYRCSCTAGFSLAFDGKNCEGKPDCYMYVCYIYLKRNKKRKN